MRQLSVMGIKESIDRLRVIVSFHLRNVTSYILFLLILSGRSNPLTLSSKSAMVFSPHQDDETLGCGGMIALKRQLGIPIKVVFMTDGRLGIARLNPEEIINIRKQEAVAALANLGVASEEIQFLDLIDGDLAALPPDRLEHIIAHLVQLLQEFMPEEVYVPHRKDFHADHEATYKLVRRAIAQSGMKVELLQYPIWIFWQNPLSLKIKLQDIAGAYRLSINSVQAQKHQAIETYQSQIPGLSRGFLRRFFSPYEIFFKDR